VGSSSNNRRKSGSANGTESGDIGAQEGSVVMGVVLLTSGGFLAFAHAKANYAGRL
jgi:hypothetical protein